MMKLYHAAASPFVRKVAVMIAEAELGEKVAFVTVSGNAVDTGTMPLAVNPLGKIPALELDDGRVLYDSRVICRYIDRIAGGRFYPAGDALWDVLVVEATADGIMDAAVLMTYEARIRPEEFRYAPWVEGQWQKVARALDDLEHRWLPHLAGTFGASQIAVAAALAYVDFRHGGRNWREGRPGLMAWEAGVRDRPSMRATVPG